MNPISNHDTLNSLPMHILSNIYSFLPKEDQIFITPKVSKVWQTISKQIDHDYLKKTALNFLKIEKQEYTNAEFEIIINLVKKNNLIALTQATPQTMVEIKHPKLRKSKLINEESEVLLPSFSTYFGEESSQAFDITWNPNTLSLSTSKSKQDEWHVQCYLHTNNLKITYEGVYETKTLAHAIELNVRSSISKEKITSPKMNQLIQAACHIQLNMFIMYTSYLNMNAIFRMDGAKELNNKGKLSFNCDEKGRILELNQTKKTLQLTLNIKNYFIGEKLTPILTWVSTPPFDLSPSIHLSVFSFTAFRVAKQLNMAIEEKEKDFRKHNFFKRYSI